MSALRTLTTSATRPAIIYFFYNSISLWLSVYFFYNSISPCLSLEVTVTSLHPPRLCRIAVLSIKPILSIKPTFLLSSLSTERQPLGLGLCRSLQWMPPSLFYFLGLSACADRSEVKVTSTSQKCPAMPRGRLPVELGSSNKIS